MTLNLKPEARRPVIVAHRGTSGTAPENTLIAFRRAVEMGFTAMELDVHRTADGQIIVLHDAAVDRTTEGTGAVKEMTLYAIRRLDAGRRRGEEFAGERIPTLAEVCALARGKAFLFVEIKAEGIADDVLAVLQAEGMEGQAIVISFSVDTVRRVKEIRPDMAAGLLTGRGEDMAVAEQLGADALCLHFAAATAEISQALHAQDRVLMVWTVNEPADARRMRDLGADFITSDFPERARAALA